MDHLSSIIINDHDSLGLGSVLTCDLTIFGHLCLSIRILLSASITCESLAWNTTTSLLHNTTSGTFQGEERYLSISVVQKPGLKVLGQSGILDRCLPARFRL